MTSLDATATQVERSHKQSVISNKKHQNKASYPKLGIESEVLKLSSEELERRIAILEEEISLFERVHDLDSPDDQQQANPYERRQLNWNVGWEAFQTRLQDDCERQSELFKKENEVRSCIALASVFEQCGDQAKSVDFHTRAEAAALSYGCLVAKLGGSQSISNKPQDIFEGEAIRAKVVEGLNQ